MCIIRLLLFTVRLNFHDAFASHLFTIGKFVEFFARTVCFSLFPFHFSECYSISLAVHSNWKNIFRIFFYLLFRFAEFSPCMMCGVSYYVCFCFECSIWFFFGALVPAIFVRILRQFRLPMNLSAVCGLLCWLGVQYMNVCDPSEIWLMNVLFTCYCCVFEFVLARTHGTQNSTRSQSAVVVRKKYIFFTFDSWKQYVFGMYCARECIF